MAEKIKDRSRKRIIEEMIRSVKPASGWKVLIVDKESMRIISACCRMFDIMEEGVSLVENIDIAREPLKSTEAIYFLSPKSSSIDALLRDFKDPSEPQYMFVHLFFTSRLPEEELKRIKGSSILSRIRALKEMNLDFIAFEQQAFHFDSPETFKTLFSPDVASRSTELRSISDKIASVCATLNEYPTIRYMHTKDNSGFSNTIAQLVQDKLDNLMRTSPDFREAAKITTNRATLLILDRAVDPIAPILHEFTYQAMVYDLLAVENDRYKFQATANSGETKEKEVLLGENDPLWATLRHMHIAETMNWLLDNFNSFLNENKASKLTSGGKVSTLKEMGEAMRSMPQYQEMLAKYSLHINMASAAMNIFNLNDLTKIAGLEQDMATGEDADGKVVKNAISSIPALLTDPQVPQLDKVRLLMLFIISQEGIKDADRKRLMDMAKISFEDQACISNLRYLGVTLLRATKGSTKKKSKDKKKQRNDAPAYDLSRYIPTVKSLAESLVDNSLSATEFPFTKVQDDTLEASKVGATSLRKTTQPKWADKENRKSEKPGASNTIGGRFIIFIAGGMTYSEMRAVYEVTAKHHREVIIGSTSLLTPQTFISELRGLKKIDKVDSGTFSDFTETTAATRKGTK